MEGSSTDQVKDVDWISKLPDDLLLVILSRLSTEEAVRSSLVSKRWENVWKHISHLVLDMSRIINFEEPTDVSNRVATLLTKIINNHHGHLESCVINHYTYQSVNGMLNTWIQALTCSKHTRVLTLTNHYADHPAYLDRMGPNKYLEISTNIFSHPSLKSLSLIFYILETPHPLSYCPDLTTLKLVCVVSEVGVLNRVLASCPSLEMLVLDIACVKKNGGPLKIIENNKLKVLLVTSSSKYIDGIRVSAPSLDIIAFIDTSFKKDCSRNFWVTPPFTPYISYNISKEKKIIWHEELVNLFGKLRITAGSLSVSVDLNNPTEFERLQKVLRAWTHKMRELEIIFKDNNDPNEENDSWNKKKNKYKDPFPNAEFHVDTVCMNNFSGSEEEFALASCLIRQGTVVKNMMIKTTSFPARKNLEIKTAVAKLRALRKIDQWKLTIKCF
ncbi:hypothetical protein Bca52824_007241 [Brassica carinata]|uniref:F-box domain-containing protein n=1 Tax=Brassica carinata TaxID=52824 RepID=A0A8X7W5X5_BRACI|nr:hypothetical protein Bca52824_007241 [Brassica carinata]